MDESDKMIRQKLSGLDTPPPGTNWRPERGWSRVQAQLQPEKAVRPKPLAWYYYAAAAFAILLIPFAVMLTDIRKQQAQIDRLAAQLKRSKPVASRENAMPANTKPSNVPVPPAPLPGDLRTPVKDRAEERVIKARPGPATRTDHNAQPEALPADEPIAALPARQAESPAPAGETKSGKADPAETSEARLLRVVSTGPKRKATSVTFVFEGAEADTAQREPMAAQTTQSRPAPKKRFLSVFGGSKRDALPSDTPKAPNNILSVLTKHK